MRHPFAQRRPLFAIVSLCLFANFDPVPSEARSNEPHTRSPYVERTSSPNSQNSNRKRPNVQPSTTPQKNPKAQPRPQIAPAPRVSTPKVETKRFTPSPQTPRVRPNTTPQRQPRVITPPTIKKPEYRTPTRTPSVPKPKIYPQPAPQNPNKATQQPRNVSSSRYQAIASPGRNTRPNTSKERQYPTQKNQRLAEIRQDQPRPKPQPQPQPQPNRSIQDRHSNRSGNAYSAIYQDSRTQSQASYREHRERVRQNTAQLRERQANAYHATTHPRPKPDHQRPPHPPGNQHGHNHRHHSSCGHYFYSGFWHNYPRWHVHTAYCGHYFYDNHWYDYPSVHVHGPYCGHFYDGDSWLIVGTSIHRHGSGCGHYYYRGHWFAYPSSYYVRGIANSFYFFINLGDYQTRKVSSVTYQYASQGSNPNDDIFQSDDPIDRAYAAFSERNYHQAVISFKRAVQATPDDPLAHFALAHAYIATGDYRSAYDSLAKGFEIDPDWAKVQFNMAELYSVTEDFEDHLAKLEDWVARFPRDYKAHFVLGYTLFRQEDYLGAKEELLYTLAWDNQHPASQGLMDEILVRQAELEIMIDETDSTTEPPQD